MNYKKIIFPVLGLLIGFVIGNLFPLEVLRPTFSDSESLNKSEYYRFIISVISALITFCAVIVALFKDDFREYWKRPKLEFSEPDQMTVEELSDKSELESSTDPLVSNKYVSRIEVKNNGNLPSLGTEVFLEKLEFKEKNSTILQPIECYGRALEWNGLDSKKIVLPVGAKKMINVIEILAPQKISKPDGKTLKEPPKILIGDIENKPEHQKGVWHATFGLYAQNHKSISFKIEMEWTGVWKSRLTEFKTQYQIKKQG